MAKDFAKQFYHSKAWHKCRKSYIQLANGLCERCLEQGRYTPGYIVHHKIHITPENIDDPNITLCADNLMYLCQQCHNIIHGNAEATGEDITFDEWGDTIKK